jgi:outer membrane lipoprotein-sorting protein
MLVFVVFLLSVLGVEADPLSTAIDNFKNVRSYQVTLRSISVDSEEVIKYFYRKPGFVKMEFIRPHSGAVVVYNPHKKKVKLAPLGFLKFLRFTLSPDNRLIRSSEDHRVDKSDIGELLKSARKLQKNGTSKILGEENIGNRPTIHLLIKGAGDFTVNGIQAYHLWLENTSFLPLKASSFDVEGMLMEEVLMEDLEINKAFPDSFFDL